MLNRLNLKHFICSDLELNQKNSKITSILININPIVERPSANIGNVITEN